MAKNLKYFHRGQLDAMVVSAHKEYYICPRGYGKSEGIDAPKLLRNVFAMPGSRGGIMSPAYTKLMQNTLPPILSAFERLGYKRDVHFFVNKVPPARLRWPKPIINPGTGEYQIYFFNGSVLSMISFDRAMSANSMSLDYLFGFEAKYLPYQKIVEEVRPANRGNRQHFGKCPWHHGEVYTTDMPTTKAGSWIFKMKNEMDPELITGIRSTYADIVELKHRKDSLDNTYYRNRLASLTKDLNTFRAISTYYCEADPFDNIELLGRKFFSDAKRDNPGIIYNTAYLNKRPKKVENSFYSGLNENHLYKSSDKSYLDSLDFDFLKAKGAKWRADGDLNIDKPLCIGMDYNAAINSMVVGQPNYHHMEMKSVNAFFVKSPDKIPAVVKAFTDYYRGYPSKRVIYFYDSTAISNSPAEVDPFYKIVIDNLVKEGWEVDAIFIGKPMNHAVKHEHIDMALKGEPGYLYPTFNEINCDFMITAMESASVVTTSFGDKKDKAPEKKPETPEDQHEHRTHITDAWDTLWLGCQFFNKAFSSGIPSGIRILS